MSLLGGPGPRLPLKSAWNGSWDSLFLLWHIC